MNYHGSYPLFDLSRIKTYPLKTRKSKVEVGNFADIAALAKSPVTESCRT